MNERLQYAIKRLQNEPEARVYEAADANDMRKAGGIWFVYPSIWPEPMHPLTKRDVRYLLTHEWIIAAGDYWFDRGPTALIYKPPR